MEHLIGNVKVKVGKGLFQIDPSSSNLGTKIISNSIDLIFEIGFEKFTFKKLGEKIGSPEASIYRYFKSKYQLLSYLISWYWGAMEYRVVFETANLESSEAKFEKAIKLITSSNNSKILIDGIEMRKLHQIIIAESTKAYLNKDVDKANEEGAFFNYKQFVGRVSSIIKEINPKYEFPQMLLTTIIEGAHLQVFFAEHLPRLTNKKSSQDYITKFFTNLGLQSIKRM